jgi:hypothetical protein
MINAAAAATKAAKTAVLRAGSPKRIASAAMTGAK